MATRVRTLFVSDIHLGCKFARTDAFLDFLLGMQPETLFIVGDFIDGWRLQKAWYWNDTYSFVLRRLIELMNEGTKVCYTPGNHDEFLRSLRTPVGSVALCDEFVHETLDGRKLLVIHGDQFDTAVCHGWVSRLGDVGYNALLGANTVFNFARRQMGFGYWSLSAAIKRKVKQATSLVGNFQQHLTHHATQRGCQGVVCGHIHTPVIRETNGFTYYNTGDWVESCTALIEHVDGRFELFRYPPDRKPRHSIRAKRRSLSPAGPAEVLAALALSGETPPSSHAEGEFGGGGAGASERSPRASSGGMGSA